MRRRFLSGLLAFLFCFQTAALSLHELVHVFGDLGGARHAHAQLSPGSDEARLASPDAFCALCAASSELRHLTATQALPTFAKVEHIRFLSWAPTQKPFQNLSYRHPVRGPPQFG